MKVSMTGNKNDPVPSKLAAHSFDLALCRRLGCDDCATEEVVVAQKAAGGGADRPLQERSRGDIFVAGRVLHAAGMLYADSPVPRGTAMLTTYAIFLVPAVRLLLIAG